MDAHPILLKFADIIINPLIKGIFILALLVFLWGVMKFIKNADDDDGRTKGKNAILWGVVGMAIMVAAGGIIRLAIGTVNTLK